MITKIEKAMVNEAEYDMKGYLNMAEKIAKKKLEMYSSLLENISQFKQKYRNELWLIWRKLKVYFYILIE